MSSGSGCMRCCRLRNPRPDIRPKIIAWSLNGILWILRTGAPWRDLPTEYGPWQTIATRFYRWVKASVWDRVLATLQRQAGIEGALDWSSCTLFVGQIGRASCRERV